MHDIKWIRDNSAAFDTALGRRNLNQEDKVRFSSKAILDLDETRRKLIFQVEQWQEKRNRLSKEIGIAKKDKDEARAAELMSEVSRIRSDITHAGEQVVTKTEKQLEDLLAEIPNLPLEEVPDGIDEHGNVQRQVFGKARNYGFTPKPHDDLGSALGYMDFEAAAKLSGARFVVLKKGLARLERAIGQFMLDLHTGEHGYAEINPPLMVRDNVMFGTGQLPKFWTDQFEVYPGHVQPERLRDSWLNATTTALDLADKSGIENAKQELAQAKGFAEVGYDKDRLWLIPTAEVSLTNLVRESILDEKELPMRLTALTPCFRAEAGAAGRDTRGMIRQHQFTKVELVSVTTAEKSKDELERMLSCAEEVLRRLGLHYRVMTLCAGDMGFSAQKTYDIEVWMPGQGDGGAYREISSCSVCGDFQARRMGARYRGADGKPRFVHTLNGSGTAVGRALIAVMETYQQQDGSIAVPEVLQPYMGGMKVIDWDYKPLGRAQETSVAQHLNGTGAIVLNLQALELHLRYFLLRSHNQLMSFPREGDGTTAENYVTNFVSLGELIDEYNKSLSQDELVQYSVDRDIVRLRDAIAHGRLVTSATNPPYTLWKFGRGIDGAVPVEFEEVLTDEWLRKNWLKIEAQSARVLACFKARGYKGLH